MQDLLDAITTRSGLAPEIGHEATFVVASFLATELPRRHREPLMRFVPEVEDLATAGTAVRARIAAEGGSRRGGIGAGLLGAVGDLFGSSGPTGRIAGLATDLAALGLGPSEARALLAAQVAVLRERAGDAWVDETLASLTSRIPLVGRFLG